MDPAIRFWGFESLGLEDYFEQKKGNSAGSRAFFGIATAPRRAEQRTSSGLNSLEVATLDKMLPAKCPRKSCRLQSPRLKEM